MKSGPKFKPNIIINKGEISSIVMCDGSICLIDSEDVCRVTGIRWHSKKGGRTKYCTHNFNTRDGYKAILIHRLILSAKNGEFVDHINGDGMDNRKSNIRICSRHQNGYNCRKKLLSKNKYKGTSFNKTVGKWSAYVTYNGKRLHLGYFESEKLAAIAYNTASKKYHGEFSRPNAIQD